jgi:hypothetical protein
MLRVSDHLQFSLLSPGNSLSFYEDDLSPFLLRSLESRWITMSKQSTPDLEMIRDAGQQALGGGFFPLPASCERHALPRLT